MFVSSVEKDIDIDDDCADDYVYIDDVPTIICPVCDEKEFVRRGKDWPDKYLPSYCRACPLWRSDNYQSHYILSGLFEHKKMTLKQLRSIWRMKAFV